MRHNVRSLALSAAFAIALTACQGSSGATMFPGQTAGAKNTLVKPSTISAPPDDMGRVEASPLLVWNGQPGYGSTSYGKPATLLRFSRSASGGTAPSAVYALGAPVIPPVEAGGGFWAGPFNSSTGTGIPPTTIGRYTRYGVAVQTLHETTRSHSFIGAALDSKQNLYTVQGETVQGVNGNCFSRNNIVYLYAAQESWSKPSRLIDIGRVGSTCIIPIALDGQGHFFLGFSTDSFGNGIGAILEYKLNVNGRYRVWRKIALPPGRGGPVVVNVIGAMAFDSSGDLIALVNNVLVKYVSASGTPQSILPGLVITAFALDENDDVYAAVQVVAPSGSRKAKYAIEEFPPGSTTRVRAIMGGSTQLTEPSGISIAP